MPFGLLLADVSLLFGATQPKHHLVVDRRVRALRASSCVV